MTTAEWIAARRAELAASASGDWIKQEEAGHLPIVAQTGEHWFIGTGSYVDPDAEKDGNFIVSAHNSYGAVLDAIEAAEELCRYLDMMFPGQKGLSVDVWGSRHTLVSRLAALTETKP